MKNFYIFSLILSMLCTIGFSQDFWQETYVYDPYDFVQDANGIIYATFGSSSSMIYSDDDGVTWNDISSTLPPFPGYEHCYYTAFCKGGVLFTHIHSGSYASYYDVGHGIFKSFDKGTTWVSASNGLGADTNITNMYLLPNGNILAYFEYGGDGKVYMSVDDGDNWTLSYDLGIYDKETIWINAINEVLMTFGSNLLYKSTDYGVTWDFVSSTYDFSNKDNILTSSTGLQLSNPHTSSGGLYNNYIKTTDNGLTWSACSNNGLDGYHAYSQCITEGDTIYCGTWWDTGTKSIYFSADLAETWDTVNLSGIYDISTIYDMIITKNGYLLASVYFDGIYRSAQPVSAPSSGITNNKLKNVEVNIYPNPTSGKITVKAEEIERIEVMDLQGKQIYTGKETEIDLSQNPKGIYIIKVTTKKGVVVEKIVLE